MPWAGYKAWNVLGSSRLCWESDIWVQSVLWDVRWKNESPEAWKLVVWCVYVCVYICVCTQTYLGKWAWGKMEDPRIVRQGQSGEGLCLKYEVREVKWIALRNDEEIVPLAFMSIYAYTHEHMNSYTNKTHMKWEIPTDETSFCFWTYICDILILLEVLIIYCHSTHYNHY